MLQDPPRGLSSIFEKLKTVHNMMDETNRIVEAFPPELVLKEAFDTRADS